MVNNWVPIVAVVTVIYALLFLLIVFDAYLLYDVFAKLKEKVKVNPKDDPKLIKTEGDMSENDRAVFRGRFVPLDIDGGGEDDFVENKFSKLDLSATQTHMIPFENESPHKSFGSSIVRVE
jgi:hypothetical protein